MTWARSHTHLPQEAADALDVFQALALRREDRGRHGAEEPPARPVGRGGRPAALPQWPPGGARRAQGLDGAAGKQPPFPWQPFPWREPSPASPRQRPGAWQQPPCQEEPEPEPAPGVCWGRGTPQAGPGPPPRARAPRATAPHPATGGRTDGRTHLGTAHVSLTARAGFPWSMGFLKSVRSSSKAMIWGKGRARQGGGRSLPPPTVLSVRCARTPRPDGAWGQAQRGVGPGPRS